MRDATVTGPISDVWEHTREHASAPFVLVGLIGAYVLVVPSVSLLPSLEPYNEKRFLQVVLLLGIGGVLLASRSVRRQWLATFYHLPRGGRWGLGIVLGLGLLSVVLAPYPFYALLEVAHLGLLVLAAGVVAAVVRRAPRALEGVLVGTVVGSAGIYAAYFAASYGAYVLIPGLEVGRETVSGFANIRFFNQYQTWTLPLLVGAVLMLPRTWRWARGAALGLVALWWMLVFASHVRATVLAMGVAVLGVGLLFRMRAYEWLKVQGAAVVGGGVLYFFAFYLMGEGAPQVVQRLGEAGQSSRVDFWATCLELIAAHPWLGVGPMHFSWPLFNFVPGAHPHNALLQWMAEWGIFSAVLVTGLAVWGGWRWVERERQPAPDATRRADALRISLVAALLAGAAHALVSGIIVMPVSQMLLVFIVGWAWGRYQRGVPYKRKAAPNALWRNGIFVALVAGGMIIVGASLQDLADREERQAAYLETTDRTTYYPRYWQQGYIGIRSIDGMEDIGHE